MSLVSSVIGYLMHLFKRSFTDEITALIIVINMLNTPCMRLLDSLFDGRVTAPVLQADPASVVAVQAASRHFSLIKSFSVIDITRGCHVRCLPPRLTSNNLQPHSSIFPPDESHMSALWRCSMVIFR